MSKELQPLPVRLVLSVVEILRPYNTWMAAHPTVGRWLRVLRLGLLQFGLGMSIAPITGTLNRVLIDEMRIPAVVVGFLISLHYFISPIRAMMGYRSDMARAAGKWRTPYLVLGVMLTYGGLACAPFALILLGGEGVLPFWPALLICTLIFLAYGAGVNIVETIYLALVSDITEPKERGKVLAALWGMLILGTVVSASTISGLLVEYSHRQLISVMQGTAILFVVLTTIAVFNQERLRRDGSIDSDLEVVRVRLSLWESLRVVSRQRTLQGLFVVVFIATMAFTTHDVLLEPYGGQVLGMSVSATLRLTIIWGVTMFVGVLGAAVLLWRKVAPTLLISIGCAIGLVGFAVISLAGNAQLIGPFRVGVGLISMGRGLFLVGSMILVMSLTDISHAGLLLGVWGIVQAMAQGIGTIAGGLVRDLVYRWTGDVASGYVMVYSGALVLLLAAVLLLRFWLGRRLQVNTIRLPWSGLEEIPADQLAF